MNRDSQCSLLSINAICLQNGKLAICFLMKIAWPFI